MEHLGGQQNLNCTCVPRVEKGKQTGWNEARKIRSRRGTEGLRGLQKGTLGQSKEGEKTLTMEKGKIKERS